ncbi:hypothetical protein LCD52_16110 [Rossellomorea vietnamensis]|uniref:hypothetical protein n=1 Tax=Rossellomorea vietnamensis TaxID=218284 RepID=UPI001CCA1F41|nr:hypothetical protein [Rossellomorea vietnamensis]MCA0150309.1 hypothetical protein [Rossellomorea vietnamensis]
MTEYIIVLKEEKVKGYVDKDELSGAVFHLEWGEDYIVYKTQNVIDEVNKSELDKREKQSLIKKLSADENFEFKLSIELDEILGDVDGEIDF